MKLSIFNNDRGWRNIMPSLTVPLRLKSCSRDILFIFSFTLLFVLNRHDCVVGYREEDGYRGPIQQELYQPPPPSYNPPPPQQYNSYQAPPSEAYQSPPPPYIEIKPYQPPPYAQQEPYQLPPYDQPHPQPQPYQPPPPPPPYQERPSNSYEYDPYQEPIYDPYNSQAYEYDTYEEPLYEYYQPPPPYGQPQQQYESYRPPPPPPPPSQYESYQQEQPYESYQQPQYDSYQASPRNYDAPYQPYQAPPYYEPEEEEYYEEEDVYSAITYQDLNTSYHCGVIPDTNYELYRSSSDPYEVADVAPYGKSPWVVLILYYDNIVCQGSLIHYNLILTSANCISEDNSLEDYELRVGDWDVLNNYNEYEAYVNRKMRICSVHKITSYSSYGKGYSSYGGSKSDLIILKSDYDPNYDMLPHVKPLCLPKSYSEPKNDYSYDSYYDDRNTMCWVAGWYGSEIKKLENHPLPEMKDEGYYGNAYYGNQRGGKSYSNSYSKEYYKGEEYSMTQKRAKVKQVPCPSYRRYSKYSYGYGSSSSYDSSSSQVCFIGVEGYDACVAEKGAAVFCVMKEPQDYGKYDSGLYQDEQQRSYRSYSIPMMGPAHSEYGEGGQYYKSPIIAAPAPSKPNRYRAVVYAVIQKPAKCRIGYDSYGNVYRRKSRPLVATKVDQETVSTIMDAMWSYGYDHTCPVTKAKYKPVQKKKKYYGGQSSSYGGYSSNYSGSYGSSKNTYSSSSGSGGYSYSYSSGSNNYRSRGGKNRKSSKYNYYFGGTNYRKGMKGKGQLGYGHRNKSKYYGSN